MASTLCIIAEAHPANIWYRYRRTPTISYPWVPTLATTEAESLLTPLACHGVASGHLLYPITAPGTGTVLLECVRCTLDFI